MQQSFKNIFHVIRYSPISVWKLYLDNQCNCPSHWRTQAEAGFQSQPRAAWLPQAHFDFVADLLEHLPASLHYSDISFFQDRCGYFKQNFLQAMAILLLVFFSREAREANRLSLANLYCCAFGIYVLVKREIRILLVPASWGEICIRTF